MAQLIESAPKVSHVTFAHDTTLSARDTTTASSSASEEPATPPWNSHDLPTPPNSHINMTSTIRPPAIQGNSQTDASTSQINAQNTHNSLPSSTDHSPSMQVHQRRAKRISAGSASAGEDVASANLSTSQQPITERQSVLAEAQRGRDRGRAINREQGGSHQGSESSRSRTPSPILGSMIDSTGHLSFTASLIPSAEEVRNLLYGQDDGKSSVREEERPNEVTKEDLQSLQSRLSSMGFAQSDESHESTLNSKEKELADMVKKMIRHARHQEQYLNSMEQTLHNTRIRSISVLTSLRTTFAHSLASEYSLRARVEAELDGARNQAKKLSAMLSKSESRNEEVDRERAMSAEEEVLWQEEMKDHAPAYALQQAARARATQMAQLQANGGKQTNVDVKVEPSSDDVGPSQTEVPAIDPNPRSTTSPAQTNTNALDEPFVEKKTEDGTVTGLGISSGPVEPALNLAALNSSPLSTIVKERNKLLSDKRYLKSRVRDTEAQRDRLELELKALRPLLVRGPASKSAAAAHITTPTMNGHGPSTPGRSHNKRERSRRRRQATMGDAEAEHLLLAARRLKELNKFKDGEEDGRPKTPPPSGTTNPRTPKTPRTNTSSTPKSMASREMMESIYQSGASSRTMPNGSPLAAKTANSANTLGRWGTHERVDSAVSGSGIEDLLHAAQTVITPEKKSAHRQSHTRSKSGANLPDSGEEEEEDGDCTLSQNRHLLSSLAFSSKDIVHLNESPKRRRVSSAALEGTRSGLPLSSPDKRAAIFQSGRRARTSTEGAEPFMSQSSAGGLSALDLLADQAAASQHPSQSSDPSGSGGEANIDPDEVFGSDEDEGMMVDDQEEPSRSMIEGGIGSHYYPRGAYGHSYAAQQPLSMGHDGYRMAPQSGYTYSPNSSATHSLNSQPWSSQNSMTAPRNGIYAPRGVSPPSNSSRFNATFHNGPRISTGNTNHHMTSSNHSNNSQSNSPDEAGSHHNNNRTSQKGGNTSPDKRLPYVRWSDEEDQKLRKAISEYGQRWESVANVVGTRSYHQCRQRYLLMRRKEAAARDGNSNDDARSATSVTASAH